MSVLITLGFLVLSVVTAWPLSRVLRARAGFVLAALYLAAAAALTPATVAVFSGADTTGHGFAIPWVPGLGAELSFTPDGLGIFFSYIATLIGAIVFLYATAYLSDKENHTSFYLVMTLFTLAMVALVLTDDLWVLFIAWELTSLASFLLIARSGLAGQQACLRTLLMTFVGGLALAAAVVTLSTLTGTTSISAVLGHQLWAEPATATPIAVLLIVAAATKSAQFPFHIWLPDAMAAATPVSAYLHAAAVVKAGIFLLLRFSPALHQHTGWSITLVLLGLVTSIVGGFFAFAQPDLKKLMAYSTVSQLGLIVAAIGTGTELGLTAAIVHTGVHALFKSGLFMMVGVIDHASGTRIIQRMPRLIKAMPVAFTLTLLGTAAMAGIPPLLGFISKEQILTAVFEHPAGAGFGVLALLLAAAGAVLTFSYCAKILVGPFLHGETPAEVHPTPALLLIPAAIPLLASAVAVFFLPAFEHPLQIILAACGAADAHPHLELFHGFTPPFWATLVVFALGGLILAANARIWPWMERFAAGRTGAEALSAGIEQFSRFMGAIRKRTFSLHAANHAVPMLAAFALISLAATFSLSLGGLLPPLQPGMNSPIDVVVLILVTAAVVSLIISRTRLAATLSLSAVGALAVVQIISLGAPDVALTQLLVEALTIIVIMLVLQKLPERFVAKHRFAPAKFLFAAFVGVGAGAAVFTFLGRRERSDLAEYFLQHTYELSGGHNVVNVILVEFRALDTMGELSVLGMAGIAMIAILSTIRNRYLDPTGPQDLAHQPEPELALRPGHTPAARAVRIAWGNVVQLQLMLRVIVPILGLISAAIFFRGHNEPGGGFIAALVGSAVVGLLYLSTSTDRQIGPPKLPILLIGLGISLAVLTGLWGWLAKGSFLQPLHTAIGTVHLSSAMVFDLGVYLAVLGLMLVSFNLLGTATVKQLDPSFGVADTGEHGVSEWGVQAADEGHSEYTRERADESIAGQLAGPLDDIGPEEAPVEADRRIGASTEFIARGHKPQEVGRQ